MNIILYIAHTIMYHTDYICMLLCKSILLRIGYTGIDIVFRLGLHYRSQIVSYISVACQGFEFRQSF